MSFSTRVTKRFSITQQLPPVAFGRTDDATAGGFESDVQFGSTVCRRIE